jgi:ATP-dependent Zn protease
MLSYGLLFMFVRSILAASKGSAKNIGKGGGGSLSEMFGTAKSNRFRQPVNVKFDDVVGMNRAK